MSRFLLALTGADRELLRGQRRHEVKLETLGGVLMFTAAMAGLSAAFAVRMGLRAPALVALVVGVAWGTGILTLDRWLVTSNQRQANPLLTILLALPRLFLAVIIGATVSVPLVLFVFDPSIQGELVVMHTEEAGRFESQLQTDPRFRDLPSRESSLKALQQELAAGVTDSAVMNDPAVQQAQTELNQVRIAYDDAERAVACERDGTCGSGKTGVGNSYREKAARRDRLGGDVAEAKSRLESVRGGVRGSLTGDQTAKLTQLQTGQAMLIADQLAKRELEALHSRTAAADSGLLARIEALHRLGKAHPTLGRAHLALALLILAIECLPVLMKLLMSFGERSQYEKLTTRADDDRVRHDQLVRDAAYKTALMAVQMQKDLEDDGHRTRLHVHRETMRTQAEEDLELVRLASRGRRDRALERDRLDRAARLDQEYAEAGLVTEVTLADQPPATPVRAQDEVVLMP